MDYLQQITKTLEDQNTTFTDMKNALTARMDALENTEAKSRRPQVGQPGEKKSFSADPEVKAWNKFARTGDDAEIKAMASTTNSSADGGYAIPKQIDSKIEALVINSSPIRQIANVVQISTMDYHKLVNLKGSVANMVSETTARTATATPQFADVLIKPTEFYSFPQVTQPMLDDAFFDIASWLADEVAEEFARAEGSAFVAGTGSAFGQPTGFLNGPFTTAADSAGRPFGTVQYFPTGVSGALPGTNPTDFLLNVVYSIKAAYRAEAVWVMPKAVLNTISQLKDSAGRYIMTPMSSPTIPATIFGFKVMECEDMPPAAANSLSIAFGNFKRGYTIADRFGTRILRDSFSNKPYVGFYCTRRTGGALVNSEAIKLIKYSLT